MERLPRETFLLICSYLDFESRFQFAYVSKSWHAMISLHNLYETVYIDKDHHTPINFFTNNKDNFGSTVKSLQVNGIGITFSQIQDWPVVLPHLQTLSLAIAEADMFSSDYEEEFDEDEDCYEEEGRCFNKTNINFKQWSRLANISEFTKYIYTGSILLSGDYPHLISMDLNFNLVPAAAVDNVMEVLIKGVQNAPNLKFLKLIVARLTLNKLQLLHHNAPKLEGLVLEDVSFGQDSSTIEVAAEQQETANMLTRLEMQGNRYSFYENVHLSIPSWLHYISQKYPNIEVLKLNQFTPASIDYESAIIHTVTQCQRLKTFNVDFCHLSTSVLSAFDEQTAIQLEKYSSQSQDLTELRNLSVSKQRHSIYRVDLVVPIGDTDLIQILSQFTGLTTINTYPSSDIDYVVGLPLQVPLNTFLKQHRRLEFLSLSSCIVYLDNKLQQNDNYISALDTLEMEKVTLKDTAAETPSVFDFISNTCPSLKVFILTARFQEYPLQKQHVTRLSLPSHTIVYLKVYIQDHTWIQLRQQHRKQQQQWFKFEREGKKIKYVLQDCDLQQAGSGAGGGGLLQVDVKQVERFVVNVPRDPFEI